MPNFLFVISHAEIPAVPIVYDKGNFIEYGGEAVLEEDGLWHIRDEFGESHGAMETDTILAYLKMRLGVKE
jgi:hypothetical protein